MVYELIIPKLGMTMKEATITRWIKSEGARVETGELVFEIETEKVTYEVEAPGSGFLHILESQGAKLPVGARIGLIFAEKAEYEAQAASSLPSDAGVVAKTLPEAKPATIPSSPKRSISEADRRIKATPVARSMAKEHGIDLQSVTGTGPSGRIVREDILRVLKKTSAVEDEMREEKIPPKREHAVVDKEVFETIPIEGIRRVIFENMYQSLTQTAQLTIHTEASAESLIALREGVKKDEQKVSYNAILLKIAAMALRQHPKINASVADDTIRIWKQIHIGLAMDVNETLIVPVIRNADLKTIREIERDVSELVQKAQEKRLSPDDLVNGTFTITNLGFADVDHFTPIIRPPESAILGVGRIVKKPSVKDERVVPEARIALSLTFDHRIIDGAPAARFLKSIKNMVEDPVIMIS
jgi:pyruvate dehydrogenase complex dihydrolipoamide acetyltransferase long form